MSVPKVPRFDLARIETRRDRILGLLFPYVGERPQQQVLADIADTLAVGLELPRSSSGLLETCRSLPNVPLTERSLFAFAWRLAARHSELLAGKPVRPWTVQTEPEWIAFEIVEGETSRDRKDQTGMTFWMQALSGTVCPRIVQKFWNRKQCLYLARALGFTSRKGRFPFSDGYQLVRLRLAGLVEPERSQTGPDFFQIDLPGSFADWNRNILKMRLRREPPCPEGFTHQCHACPIGYDQCVAAAHPVTFVEGWCSRCRMESFFDPAVEDDRCVGCRHASRMRKKGEPEVAPEEAEAV